MSAAMFLAENNLTLIRSFVAPVTSTVTTFPAIRRFSASALCSLRRQVLKMIPALHSKWLINVAKNHRHHNEIRVFE